MEMIDEFDEKSVSFAGKLICNSAAALMVISFILAALHCANVIDIFKVLGAISKA